MRVSSLSGPSVGQHMMCKDHDHYYNPIEPTTTFRPGDAKAEFLTSLSMKEDEIVEWQWYYRNDSSNGWIVCPLPFEKRHYTAPFDDIQLIAGHLDIAGYWPGAYYPRAYKVEIYYLNNSLFSEFFEVSNGGMNSPRMCGGVDPNGAPVNVKSRFTIGVDTQAYHYLRFDKMAYFNEEIGSSHNFTTVWFQPDGAVYKTHSCTFGDYKDNDTSLNYWKYGLISNDFISIDPSTPVGNWRVEVYMDRYYSNSTSKPYGPMATTPFIIGNESVANWTFMAYLDSDNGLANASIGSQVHDLALDIFLELANVTSSADLNIVVQIDRGPSLDERYGNWAGCKRFNVTRGIIPIAENAVQDLGEVDMGDPDTLKDFVNWTVNNFPANFFSLVLWDHGSGVMGICEDLTNGSDYLSLPEISEALAGNLAIMDDVMIDACSMSMAEVAYQIKDYANVLIGPEGLGYSPAPYDDYLNSLLANTSMSPSAFAEEVVKDYMSWCYANADQIHDATMTATDLTKIVDVTAAVDDFANAFKEMETLYHEQLNTALKMTKGYPGPYAYPNGTYQTGYYIDLHDFAGQANRTASNQKLNSTCAQLMLSIENAVILAFDPYDPRTSGLAVFFPDERSKYDTFSSIYKDTAFAKDTTWVELIKYHFSSFALTVKTSYPNMPVEIDEDIYNTTSDGEIQVFLQPGSHVVNVSTIFSPAPDPEAVQAVFLRWDDGNISNARTLTIGGSSLTVAAQYELQYRLNIDANFGETNPSIGKYWYNATSNLNISAIPPAVLPGHSDGERYVFKTWILRGALNSNNSDNPCLISINGPTNATAIWAHEYSLTVTSQCGTSSKEWPEAGSLIDRNIISPFSNSTGTQYVCTGWTGTGSAPVSGTSSFISFVINEPSVIQWNWKTQYQLSLHTDPKGLNPQPSVSPQGPWYDAYSNVTCNANQIDGYAFQRWSTTEGDVWEVGTNLTITMDRPYDITAQYVRAQAWWEILVRPDVMQAMLALLGTVLTIGLVGGTWVRSRKRRGIVKTFLAEIDDVYSRFKTDPQKCEEELYALRNTILEGMTDGKITEDNYDILDKRIDKYVTELSQKRGKRRKASGEHSED